MGPHSLFLGLFSLLLGLFSCTFIFLNEAQAMGAKLPSRTLYLPGTVSSSPKICKDFAYISAAQRGQLENLQVVNLESFTLQGSLPNPRQLTEEHFDCDTETGNLFFPNPERTMLFAYSPSQLDQSLWQFKAPHNSYHRSLIRSIFSPEKHGLLLVQLSDELIALDKGKGTVVWKNPLAPEKEPIKITLLDQSFLISDGTGKISAHDLQTGNLSWTFEESPLSAQLKGSSSLINHPVVLYDKNSGMLVLRRESSDPFSAWTVLDSQTGKLLGKPTSPDLNQSRTDFSTFYQENFITFQENSARETQFFQWKINKDKAQSPTLLSSWSMKQNSFTFGLIGSLQGMKVFEDKVFVSFYNLYYPFDAHPESSSIFSFSKNGEMLGYQKYKDEGRIFMASRAWKDRQVFVTGAGRLGLLSPETGN